MTQKHTPEPWDYVHEHGAWEGYHEPDSGEFQITFRAKNEKDAARIVACINEFAGKSNEEVKGYVEAMDAMYKNYCNLQSENILLKEQIEKLKEGK